jgi:cardiolipin synthase
VSRLARGLRLLLALLRRAGVAPIAAASDAQLAGDAHGLAYAIGASLWLRRRRALPWPRVQAAWRGLADGEPAALAGRLDPGDRWSLVTGNADAFDLRERLCAQARRRVDLSTYYLQADATGWRMARALQDAARRGVQVRLVVDHCATASKAAADAGVPALMRQLREAGVQVRAFRDAARPWDANHRKILLVDGADLLLGGRNHADHYAQPGWRDVELWLAGPSAAAVQPAFDAMFDGDARAPAPAAGGLWQPTTPAAVEGNAWFGYLLRCLRTARASVDIENAYVLEHAALQEALAAACRRGVRVRLATNSAESNDLQFMNWRLQRSLLALLDAGVEVHLRQGAGRTLHGKYFVADGLWVGLGSSNLDYYSPRLCHELGLHAQDAALAQALTAWFEAGLAECRPPVRPALEAAVAGASAGRVFDRLFRDIQ